MGPSLLDCRAEAQTPGHFNLAARIFEVEDQAFLRRFVAIDESWIMNFEPELKSQFNDWRATGSPRPKKFRRAP